jgi:hypothetical protein
LCLVASRGQCSLYLESCVGVWMTGVAAIGVEYTSSWKASRSSSSLNSNCVGVGAMDVATLGVGLTVSCPMASPCSSLLRLESYFGVAAMGVATLDVGLPASYCLA